MNQLNVQKPFWAWFFLILCGLFLLMASPIILVLLLTTFSKPDDYIIIIFDIIVLCIIIPIIWGFWKALDAIRAYNLLKKKMIHSSIESNSTELLIKDLKKSREPIWPWIVIGTATLPLIFMGPLVVTIPAIPLFLAVFSGSEGLTSYWIFTIGYAILICYAILLIIAIKKILNKK